jgi:hypothetical protein
MQTGSRAGMQTMEQALADLVARRVVDADAAISRSSRRDELVSLLQRLGAPLASAPRSDHGLRLAEAAQ